LEVFAVTHIITSYDRYCQIKEQDNGTWDMGSQRKERREKRKEIKECKVGNEKCEKIHVNVQNLLRQFGLH